MKSVKTLCLILMLGITMPGNSMAKPNHCVDVSLQCGKTPTSIFDSNNILWVAFEYQDHIYVTQSKDFGKSFNPPVAVNRQPHKIYTNGENRPKIVLGASGMIFVTWTEKTNGRFAGNIRFARSLDQGKTFSRPIIINTDRALIGHRFDIMHVDSQGELYIAWFDKRDKEIAKVSNKPYRGTALYYVSSDNNGESFSANTKLADHTCECCRIAVAGDSNDNIYYLWRHIFATNTRDHALISITPNKKVSTLTRATFDDWHIDSCPHHGPDMTINQDNRLFYTWFSQGEKHKGIMFAEYDLQHDELLGFQVADAVATASHPGIIAFNNEIFHVWKKFDGKETLVVGRVSADGGESWSQEKVINRTSGASDHPLLIKNSNNVYLSWHSQKEGFSLTPVNF